jgi:type I restriction enzyme S subunit
MMLEGWRLARLGDVTDVQIGGTPARDNPTYWDCDKVGNNRWVAISDLKTRRVVNTSERITDLGVRHSNVKLIPSGTTLMSFKLSIGRTGIAGVPLFTNEAIAAFLPREPISQEFLYYSLPRAAESVEADVAVKGKTLNKAKLQEIAILLPPLGEQRKIATILSSVDDAIEAAQAVIDQLQVVKKATMAELLTRGLPGRHTRFKQTEIGEMPEDWALSSIEYLGVDGEAVVRSGPFGSSMKTKDFRTSGVPVLTIQSLGEGTILGGGLFFVDEAKAMELAEYKVRVNDLVFSRVADIGRCAAISKNETGWLISPNLSRIRLDPRKVDTRFLMYLITVGEAVGRQVEMVAGYAGRPVISSTTLKQLRLPLPSVGEQRAIAAAGLELEFRIATEIEALAELRVFKSALMSVLLTGELRVTPDPEPA